MPKSQTYAEIQNLCRNPKPMPESQIYTKIPNICNNIIFLLDSNYKIQITKKNFFKIFRSIIKFVILYYILLTILEFNIYPKQFGISAQVWDFGNSLGFGISANLMYAETIFRHMPNPKYISAYIGFGTQVQLSCPESTGQCFSKKNNYALVLQCL